MTTPADGLNTGSLIQHMFTSQVASFLAPIPPLAEQRRIADAFEEQLSSTEHLDLACERAPGRAPGLRARILSAGFSGELVPQDPNDEPAAVLLERIRAERASAHTRKEKNHGEMHDASSVNGQRRRRVAKLAQRVSAGKG